MVDLTLIPLSRTLDHMLGLSQMEATTPMEYEDFMEWQYVLLGGEQPPTPEPTAAAAQWPGRSLARSLAPLPDPQHASPNSAVPQLHE